ncbi:MAG: DUF4397 domain-containing protein [Chitinophagaceae bacterium]
MKTLAKTLSAVLAVSLISIVSSCKKDDVDEYGSAYLKVVNASEESPTQSFYLLNNLIKADLDYAEYSDFINVNSGNRLSASFKTESSGASYADGELWMAKGEYYTVYLVGSGSNARIKQYEDNLSSPNTGKAKIKFIHLSDGAPSDLRIRDASGDILINNISRNIESGYKNIDPGTFVFSITGTASGNSIGNYELNDISAGKIYTIFIAGESSSNIQVHKVEY